MRVWRLLLLVTLLSGCALSGRMDSPAGMPLPELLRQIELGQPVWLELPSPSDTAVMQRQNPHDPALTDTIRQLAYPGMVLTVYQPGSSAAARVAAVSITGDGYRTAEGIRIGSTLQELSDAYGEADLLEGDEYVYQAIPTVPTATARFRVEGERVIRMQWEFALDERNS